MVINPITYEPITAVNIGDEILCMGLFGEYHKVTITKIESELYDKMVHPTIAENKTVMFGLVNEGYYVTSWMADKRYIGRCQF